MNVRKQRQPIAASRELAVDLSAVIVGVTGDQPQVLAIRSEDDAPDALPSGPLESRHRALEAGLRSWVEHQTHQSLGYVEQLYTFGDRNRMMVGSGRRVRMLSIGYLALVHETRPANGKQTVWRDWYHYFPWEDWRNGKPAILARIERRLRTWVADAKATDEKRAREERVEVRLVKTSGPRLSVVVEPALPRGRTASGALVDETPVTPRATERLGCHHAGVTLELSAEHEIVIRHRND